MNDLLGKSGRDAVTGFEGTIVGVVSYLTGCNQLLLQPQAKDGDYKDGKWFDDGRVAVGEQKINPKDIKSELNGCDIQAPTK